MDEMGVLWIVSSGEIRSVGYIQDRDSLIVYSVRTFLFIADVKIGSCLLPSNVSL